MKTYNETTFVQDIYAFLNRSVSHLCSALLCSASSEQSRHYTLNLSPSNSLCVFHPSALLFSAPLLFVLSTHLHGLLALGLLPLLPLGIDPGGKRIFKPKGNLVNRKHQSTQHDTGRLAEPERRAQETERASIVHGCRTDVERKASHHVVHQDSKVVTEIGASDAQGPHGREDENVAAGEEGHS